MANKVKTYQQLSAELNSLLEWFEDGQPQLDEAVKKYDQAMKLLQQMENHLKTADNKVNKINLKFADE